MVLASLNSARKKAIDARRLSDLDELNKAFQLYASDNNGNYPPIGAPATKCIGVKTGTTCWGDRNMPGDSSLLSALSPYISLLPTDPLPSRGWGDRYLYLDGSTWSIGCGGGSFLPGKYILWRPNTPPQTAGCLGKGFFSCCGSGGAPCGNNGGYYCAFKID